MRTSLSLSLSGCPLVCVVLQEGDTALMCGAMKGHVAVVQELLASGVDKNLQDSVTRGGRRLRVWLGGVVIL